ncbi:MAG: hypothetical protein IKS54_06375 [Erysipelotrichaceae bacterium]|nr:hypothetical protein [Erysipelotrichaceae bacterium]
MDIVVNDNIIIRQKYNPYDYMFLSEQEYMNNPDLMAFKVAGINPTKIFIRNQWFDVIPPHIVARSKGKIDGYYRFIYIQINLNTGEYYIGKVNRKKLKEIKKYQGSGLKFVKKFKKHREEFIRYFIALCGSAKESEEIEASIVNEELLKDPKCLNLVSGGGGTNQHNNDKAKREKQRKYMLDHPESFQSMIKESNRLFCQGDSDALRQRTEKIKKTMSDEKYRKGMSKRITDWKKNNPEAYEKARENNRISNQTEESRQRRRIAHQKWVEEHPDEYRENLRKSAEGNKTQEARKKHSDSINKWIAEHPEQAKANDRKRSEASVEACRRPVHMKDLNTGEILKTFSSQHDAARWLVEQGIAKNTNCVSSINGVCLKRKCTSGYGYRKKAYGFGWDFADDPKVNVEE